MESSWNKESQDLMVFLSLGLSLGVLWVGP